MKFVRDELFYYSRDENQFLRRRRAFVFVLFPDLVAARFKDPELPYQRIVMLQSLDPGAGPPADRVAEHRRDPVRGAVRAGRRQEAAGGGGDAHGLLLREPIERGDGVVARRAGPGGGGDAPEPARRASRRSTAWRPRPSRSRWNWTTWSSRSWSWTARGRRSATATGVVAELEGEDAFDVWQETVLRVLQLWV